MSTETNPFRETDPAHHLYEDKLELIEALRWSLERLYYAEFCLHCEFVGGEGDFDYRSMNLGNATEHAPDLVEEIKQQRENQATGVVRYEKACLLAGIDPDTHEVIL